MAAVVALGGSLLLRGQVGGKAPGAGTVGSAGAVVAGGDATAVLLKGLDRLEAGKRSKMRFTYLHLDHTQNFDKKGRLTAEYTRLYDVTYIGGLEYARLLEVEGKPLAGDALAEEDRRYDAAVRERTAMDAAARAKINHEGLVSADLNLDKLRTDYRNVMVGRELLDGRDCVVIDSMPLLAPAGAADKHYRIWLAEGPDTGASAGTGAGPSPGSDAGGWEIVRVDFDLLMDAGAVRRGARGSLRWSYLDGVAVMTENQMDFTTPDAGRKVLRVVADHRFSRYRRFSAEARILGPEDEPGDRPADH